MTNWPNGVDSFSDPTPSTAMNNATQSHSAMHALANDAIHAMQSGAGAANGLATIGSSTVRTVGGTNKPTISVDTAANWSANNPVLGALEVAHESDTGVVKHGDGTTAYNSLNPILSGTFARIPAATDAATLYVAVGGNDANPGLDWHNAKATVAAAYAALPANGGVIEVGYGTFNESASISFTKPTTIRGRGSGWQQQANVYPTNVTLAAGVSWTFGQKADLSGIFFVTGAGLIFHELTICDDVWVYGSSVDGFLIDTTGGGNASNSRLRNCGAVSCGGNGFNVKGSNSNYAILDGCSALGNTGWGFLDASTGTTHIAPTAGNNTAGSYKSSGLAPVYLSPFVETDAHAAVDLSASLAPTWISGAEPATFTFTNSPAGGTIVRRGRWARVPLTVTTSYTLDSSYHEDELVIFNGSSLTATLPDPTTVIPGAGYTIKNVNASALTVASAGTSKTIDGAASASLAQWAKATYTSDGTQWLTV